MSDRYAPIPLNNIDDDEPLFQVRRRWEPQHDPVLPELAASLAGPEGLIHPIVVVARPTPTTFGRLYTLVAGHRRLAAARSLRWTQIPARILAPCDLHHPEERLRLLAMAIRENTERAPLEVADRRAALERLHQLYVAVFPTRRATAEGEASRAFAHWAAGVTRLPARTIRYDLRRLFGAPVILRRRDAACQEGLADGQAPLPTALRLGQQTTAALHRLIAALEPEAAERLVLAPEDYDDLVALLEALQATVTQAWTLTAVPTARSLDAFALQVQQRVPPLLGALQGLATSPLAEWDEAPPRLLHTLQHTMSTFLERWTPIAARLTPGQRPHSQAAPRVRTRRTCS